MPAHMVDSLLFKDLFGTEEMRQIFEDRNLVQKYLDVEAALAEAEGELGIIPAEAAREIKNKCRAENLDLAGLKEQIDATWHPLVPVLREIKKKCAGHLGEYVHWGATTQDIMDTATVLQIKEAYNLIVRDLKEIETIICSLAREYKDTVMAGRTHGQHALPLTFGFKAAIWANEVTRHLERLEECKQRLLVGNFCGAVGTLAALGEKGLQVQELLLAKLGLGVPVIAWQGARDRIAEFICLQGLIAGTFGKIANEIVNLQRTEIAELEEPFSLGKISSSTMPHKRNAHACEVVVALSKIVRNQASLVLDVMEQEHERDMRLWGVEWKCVPEVCIHTSAILKHMKYVLGNLIVYPENMRRNLKITNGLILSEAIMFKLAGKLGLQEAHELVYQVSMRAYEQSLSLKEALLSDPRAKQHLTAEEIDTLMKEEEYTGLAAYFVEKVLSATSKNTRKSSKRAP